MPIATTRAFPGLPSGVWVAPGSAEMSTGVPALTPRQLRCLIRLCSTRSPIAPWTAAVRKGRRLGPIVRTRRGGDRCPSRLWGLGDTKIEDRGTGHA